MSLAYQQIPKLINRYHLRKTQSNLWSSIPTVACFNTYNKLPFGVSSAPGVFKRVMESILSGNPNVVVYIDDILVTGPNEGTLTWKHWKKS